MGGEHDGSEIYLGSATGQTMTASVPGLNELRDNRQSDRAVAVLALALIDDMLDQFIRQVIVRPANSAEESSLFGPTGLFSTTANKIEGLYRFGFLSKLVYEDCSAIRRIRNTFGHSSRGGLVFEDSQMAALIDCLGLISRASGAAKRRDDLPVWLRGYGTATYRDKFVMAVSQLHLELMIAADLSEKSESLKRQASYWFEPKIGVHARPSAGAEGWR